MAQRFLITGGTGFLGRHLVWRLAAAGHEVVFTGRDAVQAQDIIARAVPNAVLRFCPVVHGSADAARRVLEASAGVDAVVHCAALAAPWGRRRDFEAANVASTREVLAACRQQGIGTLVHISTPSVYFTFADRLGIREDGALPPPVNDYAHTKWQAEQLVMQAGLPQCVILRPRAIFGPWDNNLLPRLLRVVQGGRVPLLRGGQALLDMSYVDNVVDAIVLALRAGAPGGIYNISNGEPIAAEALFRRLAQALALPVKTVHRPYALADAVARGMETWARLRGGSEPALTRYALGTIAFSQTLDLTRAGTQLGYVPALSLDEGIARTAAWWRQRVRP